MRLRIDELAAQTGVTSRNIRAYREKGLLPPPQLVGRTGYYTEEHVQRLAIIEDLQERGFSLEAIRQTLDAWSMGGDFSHLVGLQSILNSPFHSEEPGSETVPELLVRFPEAMSDPGLISRALKLGLLEEGSGDRMRIPSPLLVEAGTEMVAVGVPLAEVLDVFEQLQDQMGEVARTFIGLVEQHLVDPAALAVPKTGQPAEMVETLQRIRPLAMEVIRPILARQLTVQINRTVRRLAQSLELTEPDGADRPRHDPARDDVARDDRSAAAESEVGGRRE